MIHREDKDKKIMIQKIKDPEKGLRLSPIRANAIPSSSIIPVQKFAPITPIKAQPSYSALIQKPVIISPNLTQKRPITLPKNQNITPQTPRTTTPSSSKENNSYFQNPNQQLVKILEEEEVQIFNKGFHSLTDFLFQKDSMFLGGSQKPRDYYQTILESTGSVKIIHNYHSDKTTIAYSKVHIFRVLSIQDWKARPYAEKPLPNYPSHPYFNYCDYQEAWYNLFYLRSYSHSWFIFFDQDFQCSYPIWFVKWFKFLGNIPNTLPSPVLKGFQKFKEIFSQNIPEFEYLLQFSILFNIPWIITWTFNVIPAVDTSPSLLQREIRVKWWDKLPSQQIQKMTIQGVEELYTANYGESTSKVIQETEEEEDEDDVIKQFFATHSREAIKGYIKEIKQGSPNSSNKSQDTELFQDSQNPYSDLNLYD